jgi:hypothetical protein
MGAKSVQFVHRAFSFFPSAFHSSTGSLRDAASIACLLHVFAAQHPFASPSVDTGEQLIFETNIDVALAV